MSPRLSILLLADDQRVTASTIHQHIRAFPTHSRHSVKLFNPRNLARSRFLDLDAFDVVVVHYSIAVAWDSYLSPWFRERLAAYSGLKVQFIQDEYRLVDEMTAVIRSLGIDVLYSVASPEIARELYATRLPDTEVLPTLTGYVSDDLVGAAVPALRERPIDVGYRGRSLPFWLGRLGHEKTEIGRGFLEHAARFGLRTDIAWSESSRIYGKRWYEWMSSCRAMLASESGSSILDFDRSAERAVQSYLAEHPQAPYEEVEAAVLGPFQNGPELAAISPRIFEMAGMRTAMVMFPGEYSGVARPNEHFIPLEKDFANIEEVVEQLEDPAALERLTDRAYEDLIASGRYSYRRFVEEFDDLVAARVGSPRREARFPALRLALEQAAGGRGYRVSRVYSLARAVIVAWLGLRCAVRSRALRRLLRGGKALRTDVFQLAILTGVHEGVVVPAEGSFRVEAALEHSALVLTSRPPSQPPEAPLTPRIAEAFRGGDIREIVWNHAPVGQYVTVRLPFVDRRISLDVGRYDSYGVYRFTELANVAKGRPELVLAALEPLIARPPTTVPPTTTKSEATS